MHARVHIFFCHGTWKRWGQLYTQPSFPLGKAPVLILQEKEWNPGPVLTQRTEAKFLPGIKPRPRSPQLSALPFELTDPPDEASTIGSSSSEYSAHGQVFHYERRNQGCSSVQRQVYPCKLRNHGVRFTRDNRFGNFLLLSAHHSLFSI